MNRRERRAEEARVRGAAQRHTAVRQVLDYMATTTDPTVSGATVMLPDGQVMYVSADVAKAMRPGASNRGRSQ